MTDEPAVSGVDHVELFVSDAEAAADWYERVLGVTRASAFAEWWETGQGPLMLSVDDTTKLALFERKTASRGGDVSPHRVAFGIDGDGFLSFLDDLDGLGLTDRHGDAVTRADAVDHGLSYSLYFTDPDGNWLELTTNDHDVVAADLA
ncbi:VOC family protein [Haloglomus litoreum]|uniref:VOC family protein n=1 Tax=Haloglomus litoreum TaxID=3034026 RepID=UPI0023E8CDA6|nr:VOC family protein [Haloglomus sp. DT116]